MIHTETIKALLIKNKLTIKEIVDQSKLSESVIKSELGLLWATKEKLEYYLKRAKRKGKEFEYWIDNFNIELEKKIKIRIENRKAQRKCRKKIKETNRIFFKVEISSPEIRTDFQQLKKASGKTWNDFLKDVVEVLKNNNEKC